MGIIQMGNLLNGATGEVDRIREGVFENKYYKRKPVGTIVLDGHKEENEFTMSVYNDGAGIPLVKMAMLFQKFSRINTPGYAGKKGTGLGLYVCKEIIEKQGGKIWAESEEGKWTRFTFALPKK